MLRRLTSILTLALLISLAGCNKSQETGPTSPPTPGRSPAITRVADTSAQPASALDGELLAAAVKGDTAGVRALLDKGANANAKDPTGRTPLTEAAYWNHPETVSLLLERGADPNIKKADGASALGLAEGKGNTEVVKLLKQAGAKD